tara:strand:- start:42 stop:2153 length:2112 start_codon:yes stop_codon:yes gene_type:complete
MSIFGYDSISDMFDGGGPGQSGDTFDNDNDPTNKVTGIAAVSNIVTGNSAANNPNSNNNNDQNNDENNNTTGAAPQSNGVLSFLNPVSIIGKLSGWANDLDPENDASTNINGREYYTNVNGMVYTYNALGLPYEVVQNDQGNFVDKLSVVDPETGLTGYQTLAEQRKSEGDNEGAAQILQEAEQNADTFAQEKSVTEQVLEWAKSAGIDQAGMQAIVDDPNKFLADRNMKLEDVVPTLNANATGTNILGSDPKYQMDVDGLDQTATQVTNVATVDAVTTDASDVSTYTPETISDKMADGSYDMTAATGTIDDDNLVDASAIETDMTGAATGRNEDGTVNQVGVAVNDYATQKFSSIIDTSTVSGKNLAKALGEGNYLDEKATIAGQMKIISEQFVNDQGQAVIPKWAQKIARSVSQTMAYDGITGSAQTSAMATAIMEATLGIAEKESAFFQSLTIKNLDNRQQAIINKANVLARFEEANLGARQAAAVSNAKAFLEMDLKNLTNEQQAALINKQERTQALFEDSKIINAQRLFTAEQKNDFTKFYDELNTQIQRHNTAELNGLRKFNAGEVNDMLAFNAELQNNREKFYQEMQYNIDTSNAKWRREVTLKQFETTWDAISTDVKNQLDISTEAQNRIWDTAENLLDFIQKTAAGDRDAELRLLTAQMQLQGQQTGGSSFFDAVLKLGGTVLGLPTKPWWLGG